MTNDPRIRALAKLAAQRIKALTNAHNAQIEAIYRDFQTQCSLTPTITEGQDGEASADELDNPSADITPNRPINRFRS